MLLFDKVNKIINSELDKRIVDARLMSEKLRLHVDGIGLQSYLERINNYENEEQFNATVTQGTWTDMPGGNSFAQYLESPATGTTALTDGTVLDTGMIINGIGNKIELNKDTVYQIGRSSLGTVSDTLTLAIAASGANKSAIASMTWIEQR